MSTAATHIVQLFDTPASLTETVTRFIVKGAVDGAAILVTAGPRNWTRIARRLGRGGYDVDRALENGHLTVLDAPRLLASFMRRGAADAALFEEHVGALLERLSQQGTTLRVYGEMVEILAEEGNFDAACQLESLWNGLIARHSFTLLCGYSAAHFIAPTAQSQLRTICGAHSHVDYKARDTLSKWLLREAPGSPADLPKNPRARRLLSRLIKHSAIALSLTLAIPA